MIRTSTIGVALTLASTLACQSEPDIAAALLRAQGEYSGELRWTADPGGERAPAGAQVIAYTDKDGGDATLRLVLHRGGLPGAGWRRGDERLETEAAFDAQATVFETDALKAILRDGTLRVERTNGDEVGVLRRVVRQSPTLGMRPPGGAVVLFDGTSADAFDGGRLIGADGEPGGLLGVGCDSRQGFVDHRIHVEFRTPFQPDARGQGRGNSGVYVQGRYECQVLDSFGLEGRGNECGGIYSVAPPIVNACLPPGQWQTYDIEFSAARWRGQEKVRDARMTVHLNGVLVHDDVAVPHATAAAKRAEADSAGGLYLQDHGNPVVYRNVWVLERDATQRRKAVLLAGRQSHGYAAHEHRAGCMLLANALQASGLPIDAEVHDVWPEDPRTLDSADVIVCFADGGLGHPFLRHLDTLDRLMARGASLVCLHYAVEVPQGVPGDHFVDWIGGFFETHWSVNPTWTATFPALPEHPITRGVRPFTVHDEWYFHMRFRPRMEGVTAILSAVAPETTMQRGDGPHSGNPAVRAEVAQGLPQHVAWARSRPDGGRGFGFTGAHVHWNWGHDDFRKVVLNAIAWCAHLDVPDGGVPSRTPDLAALQANQSGEPGPSFDAARVEQLLDSFRR